MIYLDIDGVLIPQNQSSNSICKTRASLVRRTARRLQTKIVISSQRRISEDVFPLLKKVGLLFFVDTSWAGWRTPILRDVDDNLSVRGQEIEAHRKAWGVHRHIVFDDMPALPTHHQVLIDPVHGITSADAEHGMLLWSAQRVLS